MSIINGFISNIVPILFIYYMLKTKRINKKDIGMVFIYTALSIFVIFVFAMILLSLNIDTGQTMKPIFIALYALAEEVSKWFVFIYCFKSNKTMSKLVLCGLVFTIIERILNINGYAHSPIFTNIFFFSHSSMMVISYYLINKTSKSNIKLVYLIGISSLFHFTYNLLSKSDTLDFLYGYFFSFLMVVSWNIIKHKRIDFLKTISEF
ncbi:MAG: hypothetical protein PHG99_06520 [Erysipelotrichaceae bacterium]|nr:hypothetical protein [Erysipelotrichaceae bacterium]MDD4643131.1 hypothetical protein [Erysipelotrichaceae bacterium]